MYRYTPAPSQYPPTHLHPQPYPHNLKSRSYDTTYMYKPYYSEPRRYGSYYETSYPTSSTSYRPAQTESWRHVRPTQEPQQEQLPHRSSLKKTANRHVHFDLPASHHSTSRTVRIAAEEREREEKRQRERQREKYRGKERLYTSSRPSTSYSQVREEKMPRKQHSSYSYEYDSHQQRERYSTSSPPSSRIPRVIHTQSTTRPPSQPPLPNRPTVYIMTYSTDIIRNETSAAALLASQIPLRRPPIPHLYTIDARNMRPPSVALCDRYSGISPIIQDIVMEDTGARKAARTAVKELLRFGEEENRRERYRRGSGRMEVSIGVCCHAGTHRSVAIAERIAQCVKSEVGRLGCEEGVRVVCRHVHRVRGRADPF